MGTDGFVDSGQGDNSVELKLWQGQSIWSEENSQVTASLWQVSEPHFQQKREGAKERKRKPQMPEPGQGSRVRGGAEQELGFQGCSPAPGASSSVGFFPPRQGAAPRAEQGHPELSGAPGQGGVGG